MNYQKFFDAKKDKAQKKVPFPKVNRNVTDPESAHAAAVGGDRRDGLVYVYNQKIELAVNVALATRRPMLIRGPSGSGKSSLARNVARRLGWWYYEQVITSRIQARDLQWGFDSLRRLSDAQAQQLKETRGYIEPGVLWWAFDPKSAEKRGGLRGDSALMAIDPGIAAASSTKQPSTNNGAVVLLDEIDKADPDVPNNLLVPLGSLQFKVTETDVKIQVRASRPLLMLITTNDERVLPSAFMRRCVVLELEPPDEAQLVRIAQEHFGPKRQKLYESVARRVATLSPTASGGAARAGASGSGAPSAAEYLDTVRACIELGVNPETSSDAWEAVSNATLVKRTSL